MRAISHAISTEHSSTRHTLTSFHFGTPGRGKKVYIQAGLHADEVPGMLVAQYLRTSLAELEQQGQLHGEVILVPAANPIGLAQAVQGKPFGRFELGSGVNFNRGYLHVADALKLSLDGLLGADGDANVALVRAHARAAVAALVPASDAEALKQVLLSLAIDADIVLDLHCDNQALVHLYTGTPLAAAVMPLAALTGARAVLLALAAGQEPFDEACSRLWWDLADHFGPATPLAPSCLSVTVELRGETDVRRDLAAADSAALLAFLRHSGVIGGPAAPLPAPLCAPTPLEGVDPLNAPHNGVLVMLRELGEQIGAGEAVAELIDPVSGAVSVVHARVAGVLFACTAHRHLLRGMNICKIAGATAFRTGNLLGQ